jgi:hypothetical protein
MKNIKIIEKEITDAVESFNSTHEKKLTFIKGEQKTGDKNIKYVALYSYDGKTPVNILGCAKTPHMACKTSADTLDFLDEFLDTLN